MALYLENKNIGQYITYSRGLDLLKQCLIDFSKNKVIQPLRTRIPINCENGLFLNMSCYSESLGVLGAKLLTLYPRNTTCPVHQGTILLYNEINGSPQAVLDAEYITGLRTSIVSTIASQCFAKKTSKVMSIIGCGEEAKWHVKSHLNWKNWEKIYVIGKSFEEAKEFSDKLNEKRFSDEIDSILVKMKLTTLFLSLFSIFGFSYSLYSSSDDVVELTSTNFNNLVKGSDEIWFIEFYAPWCGHCQTLAPEWKKAASALKGVVKVGAVNADQYRDLAGQYGIRGIPAIKIFAKNKYSPYDYQGGRTAESIIQMAMKEVEKLVN